MSNEEASIVGSAAAGEIEIDFETWADLSARLLKLDEEARFDFLEEREIDAADYASAEQRWVMALSDDLSAEKMDRVDFYAAKCAAEMQRRAAEAKRPAAVAVDAPAPIEQAVAPAIIAVKEVPAPVVAPPVAFFAVEPPIALPPPAVVVFTAPLPPALAAVVSLPPVVRAPAHLSGTMMTPEPLAGAKPAAAALPFGQAASPEFVAGMSAPRAKLPEPSVGGETLPLGVDLLGSLRNHLPFVKAAAAAPVAGWPQLTLDTYASLCAELAMFPERAPDILKKYGIADEVGRRGVDREWAERLAAHPETQALWQRKVVEFRAWLARGGR